MSLYNRHIQTLVQRYNEACDQFQLNAIAIHSGSLTYYHGDDLSHPFHPTAFAQQWLPYNITPDTWILFSKATGLTLYWPAKQDFWHVSPVEPSGEWTEHWQVNGYTNLDWLVNFGESFAVISNSPESIPNSEKVDLNPTSLINWLNFDRAVKTEWEIEQLRIANQRAVKGHVAAQNAFLAGLSEAEIHQQYLVATEQQQIEEPYGSIVGLNEASAVLHYEQKSLIRPVEPKTLLIDAGVKQCGYASDITRTFTTDKNEFHALVQNVDTFQQQLIAMCTPDTNYLAIHEATLKFTAQSLIDMKICSLGVEEQLHKRIPQVFFPHGVGHLLGLQVHDAGGHQKNRQGELERPPEHAPFLRLTRKLEDGVVITIEPGIYFIPMLINKMVSEIKDHGCDLQLIEQLKPFGGIRIEDNIVVRKEGPLNLTRASFDEIKHPI